MRIVIDMQGAQTESRFRGIGRYVSSLAKAIVSNRGDHDIILLLNGLFPHTIEQIRADFEGLLPQDKIRVWYASGPVREYEKENETRRKTAGCIREAYITALEPDILFIPSLFEGYWDDAVTDIGELSVRFPVAVVFYDLIPLLYPDLYLRPDVIGKDFYFRKLDELKKATVLFAISEWVKNEGIKRLSFRNDRIFTVFPAGDKQFRPLHITEQQRNTILEKYGIGKPFILYTGGNDRRKNLKKLIHAFALLPETVRLKYQLVLAGRMDADLTKELIETGKDTGIQENDLIFPGYVPDQELVLLYNLCEAFVFPSICEGFGLPVLEAMACGAAVVSSNTSSIPEVIGRTDVLFDPNDEKDICNMLLKVLTDTGFKNELKSYNPAKAIQFSWYESARKAIKVMETIVGDRTFKKAYSYSTKNLLENIAKIHNHHLTKDTIVELSHYIAKIPGCPERKSRNLFVDISELYHRDFGTGVQRVTKNILKQFLENPPSGYHVIPVYGKIDSIGYKYANAESPHVHCTIDYEAGDVFLGLDLQHHTTRVQYPFLCNLRAEGVKVVFLVYDLLPIQFPQYWPAKHFVHKIHEEWLQVVTRFDGAVCISRAVAYELVEWMKQKEITRYRPFRIAWFPLGADIRNPDSNKSIPENATPVPFDESKISFLMVGTLEPRKGYGLVLAAMASLWQEGMNINLVIVGKQGWLVEDLVKVLKSHPEKGNRLFWLNNASDRLLEQLYSSCTCLIAASEGEGFGLPIVEAALHGIPIIARDIPVFREVAGQHAYYFPKDASPEQLADALKEWVGLYKQQKHPVSSGIKTVTWKESSEKLLDIILTDKWEYTIKI